MRIQSLEVKNMRNHEHNQMVFEKLNFIVGKNNAGKSTIRAAMKFALTGESDLGSVKDLVRHGEKEAAVQVDLSGLGIVSRAIKEKGTVVALNGNRLPDKEMEKEFVQEFGVGYAPLSALMNAYAFISMKPNEQKDFLFTLSNVTLTPQRVIDFMDQPSAAAQQMVTDNLPKSITIEAFDDLYKRFFDGRRDAKKERDGIKNKLDMMGGIADSCGVVLQDVLDQIKVAEQRGREIVQQLAVITERERQKAQLNQYLTKANERLALLDQQISPNFNLEDAECDLFGLVCSINEGESQAQTRRTVINTLTGQNKSLSEILRKLDTTICPLSAKLICKTDKTVLTGDLQKQIEANDEEMAKNQRELQSYVDLVAGVKKQKETLEKQIGLSQERLTLIEQKEAYERDLAKIIVDDKAALLTSQSENAAKVSELIKQRDLYNEWQREYTLYCKAQKDFEAAEAKVDLYEYLVAEFSPKGVKSRILQRIVTPIEDHCNKVLVSLTGGEYQIRFDFTDGFAVMVETNNGYLPLASLSSSERLRLGVIFQDAVNNLTNANTLFIDDAEMLDGDNLKLLMATLDEIKDRYDSIFVIATMDKQVAAGFKVPESKVFFVENGKVEEV